MEERRRKGERRGGNRENEEQCLIKYSYSAPSRPKENNKSNSPFALPFPSFPLF